MKKGLLIYFLLTCSLFAHKIESVGVGYGYTKMTLNEGIVCLIRPKPASVLILTDSGQFLSEISVGVSYPTWAIHHAGNVFVSDYHRASVAVYTIFGRLVKRIQVGNYPTVLKVFGGRLYVLCSKDPSIYRVDLEKLEVEGTFTFDSPTLYFELTRDGIVYLHYYATDKTIELVGSERKSLTIKDFRTPLKYVQKGGRAYLLGYMDGKLACLDSSWRILWQQNLDDLARDMLVMEDVVIVGSLVQPRLTFVDLSGRIVKHLPLPNTVHRLEQIRNLIVALNHVPGEVYFIDPLTGKIDIVQVGKYAVEMCKTVDERLLVLCSDSGELFLITPSL
ncbi:YncE family protein [Pseudothermotoga sp.]